LLRQSYVQVKPSKYFTTIPHLLVRACDIETYTYWRFTFKSI